MDANLPDKPYFRIGEVSKILQVRPYVIRFWETEFKSVKPVRATSGHRLYRKKDVEALILIKKLLYEQQFTIRGAKQFLLKESRAEVLEDTEIDRRRLEQVKKVLTGIRELIG